MSVLNTGGNIRDNSINKLFNNLYDENKVPNFSFINNETNTEKIYPFPSTLEEYFNSNSAQYNKNFKFSDFLENIPCAKIRAYVPDTVLNYVSDLFSFIAETVSDHWNGRDSVTSALNDLMAGASDFLKIFSTQSNIDAFSKYFLKEIGEEIVFPVNNIDDNLKSAALFKLPYILYYKLMGSTNNMTFTVPTPFTTGIFDTDGSYGWNNADTFIFNSNERFQILNALKSKLNLTFMPTFNASNYSNNNNSSLTVEFDLINDTIEHAAANYKFIQTLTLQNLWVHNSLFSLPANLYDVKIPGGKRLFMCTGDFKVTFKGAARTLKDNKNFKPFTEENNFIRIPEAYSVSLTFKSLLPENFNTYMLGICADNNKIYTERIQHGVAGSVGEAFKTSIEKTRAYLKEKITSNKNEIDDLKFKNFEELKNNDIEFQNKCSELSILNERFQSIENDDKVPEYEKQQLYSEIKSKEQEIQSIEDSIDGMANEIVNNDPYVKTLTKEIESMKNIIN